MRIARTVHERLARADAVAFLDVHVHAARQRVLPRFRPFVRDHENLAHALHDAAVTHDAVDFRDDRGFARLPGLEQLDDARQTAGDVLGLRRLARNLREDVAGTRVMSPSCTIKCAFDGMWYLCSTTPSAARISIAGCFFSSGESTMMSRDRPVISSHLLRGP